MRGGLTTRLPAAADADPLRAFIAADLGARAQIKANPSRTGTPRPPSPRCGANSCGAAFPRSFPEEDGSVVLTVPAEAARDFVQGIEPASPAPRA